MNVESISLKYLDCLSLLQRIYESGRQSKAPACSRSRFGKDQEEGEITMLVIWVRFLGSVLCLPAKHVLSYIILSHTERIKHKIRKP